MFCVIVKKIDHKPPSEQEGRNPRGRKVYQISATPYDRISPVVTKGSRDVDSAGPRLMQQVNLAHSLAANAGMGKLQKARSRGRRYRVAGNACVKSTSSFLSGYSGRETRQ